MKTLEERIDEEQRQITTKGYSKSQKRVWDRTSDDAHINNFPFGWTLQ